jgi:hypothetical protein
MMAQDNYRPRIGGLRQIGQSPAMAAYALQLAQEIAAKANAEGESKYVAAPRSVRSGWANEARAGAVVQEVEHSYKDSRDRVLVTVAERMRLRGYR